MKTAGFKQLLAIFLLFFINMSGVSASPFDGHITVWDESTGGVVENVPITGDADLANNILSINPAVVDGSLMTFTGITIYQPGPATLFSTFDSASVGSGQIGARFNLDWKGSTSLAVLNIFNVYQTTNGPLYIPSLLPGATVPGGLINQTQRMSVYILGLSSLGNVSIDVVGGNSQECQPSGGNDVTFNANYELIGNATSVTVDWIVDNSYIGSGDSITTFLPLGSHHVSANIIPNTGSPKTATAPVVSIVDTQRPSVVAMFKLNGVPVTSIPAATMSDVEVSVDATDVCDPSPVPSPEITLTQVHMISNGGVLPIQATGDRVELATTQIKMIGSASDASGNTQSATAVLNIEY